MSWSAYLHDDRGHEDGSWNYTHNVGGMIAAAYEAETATATQQATGPLGKIIGPAWWDRLNGATGTDGRDYLAAIVRGLEADPDRYRAMNPANGWGDYDDLLRVLRAMRDAVPDWPTTWTVYG